MFGVSARRIAFPGPSGPSPKPSKIVSRTFLFVIEKKNKYTNSILYQTLFVIPSEVEGSKKIKADASGRFGMTESKKFVTRNS